MEENKETISKSEENQQDVDVSTQKKIKPLVVGGIIIAAVVVVGGIMFSRQKNTTSPTSGETQGETTSSSQKVIGSEDVEDIVVEEGGESDVQIVEVEGGAFYFKPDEIRVKQGETVKIVFTNAGGMHDFVIDELNVKTKVTQTGEKAEVEFVANQKGEFEYYCSIADHRVQGMVGTLTVE